MTVILERSIVTTTIKEQIAALGFPVGDVNVPQTPYGWQGEADATADTFIPWVSLTPLPGTPQGENLASTDYAEWLLNYNVFHAGVDRTQTERLADRVRQKLAQLVKADVDGEVATWRIQYVRCVNVGGIVRVGEQIPYHYTQSDTYLVRVTQKGTL